MTYHASFDCETLSCCQKPRRLRTLCILYIKTWRCYENVWDWHTSLWTGVTHLLLKQTDSSACTGSVSVTGSDLGSFKGSQHLGGVVPLLSVNLRTLHHVFSTLGLQFGSSKFLSSLIGDESAWVLNKAKIPRIFLRLCQRWTMLKNRGPSVVGPLLIKVFSRLQYGGYASKFQLTAFK